MSRRTGLAYFLGKYLDNFHLPPHVEKNMLDTLTGGYSVRVRGFEQTALLEVRGETTVQAHVVPLFYRGDRKLITKEFPLTEQTFGFVLGLTPFGQHSVCVATGKGIDQGFGFKLGPRTPWIYERNGMAAARYYEQHRDRNNPKSWLLTALLRHNQAGVVSLG